jgi:hypothetical protein
MAPIFEQLGNGILPMFIAHFKTKADAYFLNNYLEGEGEEGNEVSYLVTSL